MKRTVRACENQVMRYGIVTWIILIVVLSLSPLKVKALLGTQGLLHNWGHLSVYLVTAALICWNAEGLSLRLFRCLGVILFAVALEILEAVLYRVPFEWKDVFLDLAGVVLGVATVTIVRPKVPRL
ncbi:MAG: hypothetical protein WA324_07550 [Bryobacteraceae bacterium]